MLRNNLSILIKLVLGSLILFLIANVISELLASSIIFLKKDTFSFSWERVFASFRESGYVGGLILGVGLWIKVVVKEYKERKNSKSNKYTIIPTYVEDLYLGVMSCVSETETRQRTVWA